MHAATVPHFRATSRRMAASVVAIALLLTAVGVAPVAATTRGDRLRHAANVLRENGHLDPVVGTVLLDDIADARADQMAGADTLTHDLDYVGDRLDRAGVCHGGLGEIIAWESRYSDYSYHRTMGMWRHSAGHYAIIMTGSYNGAGGSWATASDGDHYSVMVFAELCENPATTTSLLKPAHRYDPDRRMILRKGKHTGYKLTSTGAVLASTSVTFDTWKGFRSAGRARVDGHAWLKVSTGPLAGYWVRESPRTYVKGMTAKRSYQPARQLTFAAGSYTGRTFDRRGRVTDTKSATLAGHSGASASARAIINGRPYFRMKNGIWAGFWIRDSRRVNPA